LARELVNKEPVKEPGKIKTEIDRLWDAFLFGKPKHLKEEDMQGWSPALEVRETKTRILINAEIPGVDPKDIRISLSEGMLTIKGERTRNAEGKEENLHLLERKYGSFTRLVRIPREVEAEKITASYKNGVLSITVPKSEETKSKVKIKIK